MKDAHPIWNGGISPRFDGEAGSGQSAHARDGRLRERIPGRSAGPDQPARFIKHPDPRILRKWIATLEAGEQDELSIGNGLSIIRMWDGERSIFELRYTHKRLFGGEATQSRLFDASGNG